MGQNMDNPNSSNENQPQPNAPQESPAATEQPQVPPQPAATPEPTVIEPTEEPSKDAKMWAMFCHLAALAILIGIPFAWVIGPLIIWLIKKDDFAFVEDQGKESLNFQISVSIYILCCLPLICLAGIGVFLIPVIAIADLVFIIIGAINASNGQAYRYPCCIRMIK